MPYAAAGGVAVALIALGAALWAEWGVAVSLAVDVAALCF